MVKNVLRKGGPLGAQRVCLPELPGGKGVMRFQEAVWTGNVCLGFSAQKEKLSVEVKSLKWRWRGW